MAQLCKHELFISYSFKDQQKAEYIVNLLLNQYKLTYWLCTQQVRAGNNYKELIYQAICDTKLVILLQSEHSVASSEVPKEIDLAIRMNKPVIPFVLDESKLVGGMAYDLTSVNYVDATKPTLEERVEELAYQLYAILGKDLPEKKQTCFPNMSREHLVSMPMPVPKSIFCGRDALISEIRDRLTQGDPVLFLHGIGGIGKTQIAKQYAKKYKNDYDTVIYATYEGSLQQLILQQIPFATDPETVRLTMSDGTPEPDDVFFERKLNKIKQLANDRTLIILDNFDTDNDPHLTSFTEGNYHLIITTRNDYARFYPTVSVLPLDSDRDLTDIFMHNYNGMEVCEDDALLPALFNLVGRHTYTVELLALHMENSGQTVTEMITALQERGIMSLDETVRGRDMQTQVAYENLLKMFSIFDLNDEERKALMLLSLMPLTGVEARAFRDWAGFTSYKPLLSLENKSWLVRNAQGICLHPVIRDTVRKHLPADWQSCKDFLQAFLAEIDEKKTWHFTKTKKEKCSAVAKSMLQVFDCLTDETYLLYYRTQVLLSFGVDAQKASELALQLFEYSLCVNGENSFETGRIAMRTGWLYTHNAFLPDSAEKAAYWLQKAIGILEQCELTSSDQRGVYTQCLGNLSKISIEQYNAGKDPVYLQRALDYAQRAVETTSRFFLPGDTQYPKVAGARIHLSTALMTAGQAEEAYDHVMQAVRILTDLFGEEDADVTYAHYREATVLYQLGKYEQALSVAAKNAERQFLFFGLCTRGVDMYELCAKCCLQLNRTVDAVDFFRKALDIAGLIYTPQAQQLRLLQQQYENTLIQMRTEE